MIQQQPEYSFDERGLPTLAKKWDGTVPEIPTFPETPSGHRRKGELETLVDYIVKEWLVKYKDDDPIPPCTVEYITYRCEFLDGKKTYTSSVWGLLKKWQEWEYAEISKRPASFLHFTEYGMAVGLAEIQRKQKRAEKRNKESRMRLDHVYSGSRARRKRK